MKKINKYCLSLACLLGIGGMTGMALTSNKNVVEVRADTSTLFSCDFKNERSKLSGNFEFDHAMTYGGSGYTGNNYYTGYDYWDSLTVTYLNPSQSIVSSISFPTLYYQTSTYSQDTFTMNIEVYIGGVNVKTQQINNFEEKNPASGYFFYKTTGSNVVDGLESYTQNGGSIAFKFISSKTPRVYGFSCDTDPTVLTISGYASHDVTLHNGSGTGPTSIKMVEDYPLYPLPSIPTIENGTFAGYYDYDDNLYYNADGTPAVSTGDNEKNLYAHWDMNGTTITLDKQGGTGGSDSALGVKDETLPDIEAPTKSGYTFNGYYKEENGQGTQYYGSDGTSSFTWNSDDATATIYASWTIKSEVQNAIDKIAAIGEVSYPGSGDKITAARTAYEAVGADDKAGVSNYSVLEAAETEYENQKNAGANSVKGLINAIGTVTLDSEDAITTARTAYNALTTEQKALVTNYQTLEDAETRLAELKAAKDKADEVVTKINAIGEVSYPDSGDAIKAARDAYDALTNDDERGFVSNYSTLTAAEIRYQQLKEAKEAADPVNALIDAIGEVKYPDSKAAIDAARAAYNSLTNDDQRSFAHLSALEAAENTYVTLRTTAINSTKDLINAIGTISYPESGDAIKAARDAYNALLEADKSEITNYGTLTTAEETYKTLKDQAEATVVKELINAIGEVSYPDSNNTIKAAREAYDALSPEAKAHVDNLGVLTAAETEFETKREAAIAHVEDLIDAIGTVSYPGSKEALDAARTAYDALLGEDKVSVSNYETLTTAETTYNNQKQAGANTVTDLINGIGNVSLDSEDAITTARTAYNALTTEQKALVTNYQTLEAAEVRLAELKTAKANADEVVSLINQIGEVSYPNSGNAIKAAREAYDALTNDDERGFVSNYQNLLDAEATYNNQKQAGASAVTDLINNIGNVEYSQECKDKIDAAREAYNALTDEQKALVTNYSTLTHDEEVYAHVQEVVEKINGIGDVGLNSGDEINTAKEAYDSLTDEEKALIPTYHDTLVTKEQTYTKLVHDHKVAVACAVVFGILGGLILLVGIAYVLLMFVFNKWIKVGDKVVRVLRFKLGSKDGKVRYLAFPCKFAYRTKEEVFNKKEDALK